MFCKLQHGFVDLLLVVKVKREKKKGSISHAYGCFIMRREF
jgi:hypothetical protein